MESFDWSNGGIETIIMPKKKDNFICCECERNRPYYARGMCRSCYEKWLKSENKEYTEKQRENSRQWAEKNKEKKKSYDVKRKLDPELIERDKKTKRKSQLKRDYGLSEDLLNDLVVFQENKCAICGRMLSEVAKTHIDHEHGKPKNVRGILCSRCNNGLGMLGDTAENLEKALNYLKDPPGFIFMENIKNDYSHN